LTWSYCYASSMNVVQLGGLKIQCKSSHVAMARKKASLGSVEEEPSENEPLVEKKATKASKPKKVSAKTTKKKSKAESPEGTIDLLVNVDSASTVEGSSPSGDGSKKKIRKTRKKGNLISLSVSMLRILCVFLFCLYVLVKP